jgi:hypothetical protein
MVPFRRDWRQLRVTAAIPGVEGRVDVTMSGAERVTLAGD